ncbi:MAG: hypothetical protein M0Z95_16315 [Actinomycetota bacterium]|jgi:hypothetical protein|nr:hypothetical protein [Actinomycetota bacterium]
MARSGKGASVVGRDSLPSARRVRDTVEVKIAAFSRRLARAVAEAVDDGCHSGSAVTPATREPV